MSLEDEVNNRGGKKFIKKALKAGFNLAVAAASGIFSYGVVGISGPLTGIAFAVGSAVLNAIGKNPDKKSKGIEGLIKDFSVGSLTGIVGVWGYDLASAYFPTPGIARAVAGVVALNPIFTGAYMGIDYIVKNNFNPSGIINHFSRNYLPVLKNSTLWLGLPVALTINGYGIPATISGLDLRGYPSIVVADMFYRIVAGTAQLRTTASSFQNYSPASAH